MWKKITVVAGGMALAVALPFAALAVTTDEFPDVLTPADAATETVQAPVEPTGPWVSPNAVDPIAIQQAEQTMVRQQPRVHAETGPPEGFEPVQQRLHADEPLGMGPGNDDAGQARHMANGHQNAPMAGPGSGECPNDGTDCPNADDPSLMNQYQNENMRQTQDMAKGNPDAPMAGAGTGNPEDCPHDEPVGGQGSGNGGRGGRDG
jgi:hypothetical protein